MKLKALIVEDEYVSRRKLEKILGNFCECHISTTVSDGYSLFSQALKNNTPFNLVSLDIVLPDGTGIDLLYKIRKLENKLNISSSKRSKIIMATSHSDIRKVKQCIKLGCNDFIVKPFNKGKIIDKLNKLFPERFYELKKRPKNVLEEVIYKLKKGDLSIPSISNIWMMLQNAVSEGASLDEIAGIIKQDPSISYKIISVANSPIYKAVNKIVKIEDALSRIGLEVALRHIHNIYARGYFQDNIGILSDFLNDLWIHSIAVANLCVIICDEMHIILDEDPYLLGLFHDIGKLVFIKTVSELIKARGEDKECRIQDILFPLGNFHSDLGMALLSAHNFPYTYLKVAKFHNKPEGCSNLSKEVLVVNLANEIAKSQGYIAGRYMPQELNSLLSYKLLNIKKQHLFIFGDKLKEVMDIAALI